MDIYIIYGLIFAVFHEIRGLPRSPLVGLAQNKVILLKLSLFLRLACSNTVLIEILYLEGHDSLFIIEHDQAIIFTSHVHNNPRKLVFEVSEIDSGRTELKWTSLF